MPTVNAVEIANSGDTAPMLGPQVVKTSNQLHNALLAHKVADYNHTRAATTGDTRMLSPGNAQTDVRGRPLTPPTLQKSGLPAIPSALPPPP